MIRQKERVGIYGGTFSPVHVGHVKAARTFVEQMGLDKLYIVPSNSAHRRVPVAALTDDARLCMARIAFEADSERTCVSDIEISGASSYTVDTLRHFAAPERKLYLLVGTDMFLILDKWYGANDIFSLAEIVLARRVGEADALTAERTDEYRSKYGARVSVLEMPVCDVSSTRMRELIANGEDITGLVPEGVKEYINDNKLYR